MSLSVIMGVSIIIGAFWGGYKANEDNGKVGYGVAFGVILGAIVGGIICLSISTI